MDWVLGIKEIFSGDDKELNVAYIPFLILGANLIPGLTYIFCFKRDWFIGWEVTRLMILSVTLTAPIFILNCIIMRQYIFYKLMARNLYVMERATEEDLRGMGEELSTRSQKVLYETGKKMVLVFPLILMFIYNMGYSNYIHKYKLLLLIICETMFFVGPTLYHMQRFKKAVKDNRDR